MPGMSRNCLCGSGRHVLKRRQECRVGDCPVAPSIAHVSEGRETSARGRLAGSAPGRGHPFPFWFGLGRTFGDLCVGNPDLWDRGWDWLLFWGLSFCGLFTRTSQLPGHRSVPEPHLTTIEHRINLSTHSFFQEMKYGSAISTRFVTTSISRFQTSISSFGRICCPFAWCWIHPPIST